MHASPQCTTGLSLAQVRDLSLSRRQMVEIAKALARRPRILILGEATSALTAADVTRIYAVLKRLRAEGLALLYIAHRMHEIAELADDCTVFRGGRLNDILLHVRAGEVVGLGGLDGQGQRELLLALFGVLRGTSGQVLIQGGPVRLSGPHAAKSPALGMALIPEDRKTEGLMLPTSVRDNLSFAALGRLSRWGVVDATAEREAVRRIVQLLTALGVLGVPAGGCLCGALNGLIVIYGRLQPIVATIATGAIFHGAALVSRRVPGGDVNAGLAEALTGQFDVCG